MGKPKSPTLSKGQKALYVGMGAGAVFGILSIAANGLTSTNYNTNYSGFQNYFSAETRRRLRAGYGHVLGGIALTAASSYYLFRQGVASKMARMSPFALFGGSFLAVVGTSMATQFVDYETNPILKYSFWTLFNVSVA